MATPDTALRLSIDAGVATLTLARPEALNAFNQALRTQLREAFDTLEADPSVRVLLLKGEGRAFCAGADLKEAITTPAPEGAAVQLQRQYNRLIRQLRELPFPVVAGVNGIAAGAGFSLALACDVVLAAESASFAQVFSKIGLVPDLGSSFFLPRTVGRQRAMALMLSGEPIDAATALQWGIALKVLPDAGFAEACTAYARTLVNRPTGSLAQLRRLLDLSGELSLGAQMEMEAAMQGWLGKSTDAAEAIDAFVAKRTPAFKGR
jgi:2-(1,2-epoxy-1,2-dihydrophenyl)acetyl-CoA isomerase